jgi:hypothetical protein
MNARLIALLVSGFFTLPAGSIAGPRPAKVEGAYYLKVRSAPSFEAAERGALAAGDEVDILEEVGRWAKVRLANGTTGYVSRKYLAPLSPADSPKEGATDGRAQETYSPPADPGSSAAPAPVARTEGEGEHDAPIPEAPPSEATEDKAREAPPATPLTQPQAQGPPPQRNPWTAAEVEEVRETLHRLEATQDRFAGMLESRLTDRGNLSDPVLAVTGRQVAFWLGLGYVIGWSTTLMIGRWRERRKHHRLRV